MYNKLNLWLDVPEQGQREVAYALVDRNLTVRHIPPLFAEWLGVEPKPGQSLTTLFPELATAEEALRQLVRQSHGIFTLTRIHRVTAYTEDRYFNLQIEVTPHLPTSLLVTLIDITRQVHLEARLQQYETFRLSQKSGNQQLVDMLKQHNRDLLLLNRAGQALTATLSTQEVVERLLQVVIEMIGAEGSSVWLRDEEEPGYLVCQAVYHELDKPAVVGQRLQLGQGIAGWVAQTGESTVVLNAQEDSRFFAGVDACSGFTTESLLAAPLRLRDTIMGVLEVVNKTGGDFTADDLVIAETLAVFAAIAIENARLVEALQRQASDLQARNEELDAFAHTVAHDLQNPIALLIGYAGVLLEDVNTMLPEKRTQVVETLVTNARKVSSIVEELLVLSSVRKLEVELQPLDTQSIVTAALNRLTHLIAERQANIVLPQTWPVALGHAPWIEEVWENYLSNALKYGGVPPHVELGGEIEADGMVRFWVRDNGAGLTPEAQARLFTPATRLSDIRVTGHGLGLSIVRRIVQKLGGQVSVESEVGKGSVFSFTLPGVEEETRDLS